MRTRNFLIVLGTWAAGAWSLPGDTLILPPAMDSSRVRVSGDREMGRTLLRHRLEWVGSPASGEWRVLDTSLFRYAGDPEIWAGEAYLHAGWAQRSDSGWGVSWRLWNRTNGLGAREASVAENAWRQSAMGRLAIGDSSLAGGLSLGALLERVDPGTQSPGIGVDETTPDGLYGAGSWAAEGRWAGLSQTPARLEGQWSDLFPGSSLRQTHTSLHGSIRASLSGDGTDTASLDFAHDSLRQRSTYFLTDRAHTQRQARVAWTLPVGSQNLSMAGSWDRNRFEDHARRNPGLVRTGSQMDLALGGPLRGGWRHGHAFLWSDEKRVWNTPRTGDLLANELQAAQDRRDQDAIAERILADTLGWRTERFGGGGVWVGLVQSLRAIRHPLNETPTSADRPDEDVSKRQLFLELQWDRFSWNGRSLFSWSILAQEDAYLRAVHSAHSWKRGENRLGLNLAVPLTNWLRPDLSVWAREQRNVWRFLPDRREGLLEYGMTGGGEFGPVDAAWLSLQWTRWRVKTGMTIGDDFAPDRIQDEWLPEARAYLRWGENWIFEPWFKRMLERVRVWEGADWMLDNRSVSQRLGGDLRWEFPRGGIQGSVAKVWNHFEEDAWIGSIAAHWAW